MVMDFLLELGADPLIPSNGHTDMLEAAVVYGYDSIFVFTPDEASFLH